MSLTSYIKENKSYDYIRTTHAGEILLEHGKEIDSILYKFNKYAFGSINNNVDINIYESNENIEFTLEEQSASNELLIYIAEECIESLQNELIVCKHILRDDVESINENLLDTFKSVKNYIGEITGKAKTKALEYANAIKEKMKDLGEFITMLIKNTIKTVADMVEKLMTILEKMNCTISALFEKIGFDKKEAELSWDELTKENIEKIKNDPKIIDKFKVYGEFEKVSEELKNDKELIVEVKFFKKKQKNEEEPEKEGTAINQNKNAKGWKGALWKACKQLFWWATVCVAIPGVVAAFFPGTFLALLVSLACKLAWSGYKIFKLWGQFKKVKSEWKTYDKKTKWISAVSLVLTVIAIAINIGTIASTAGKVLDAFAKTGGNLMAQANLGIQPDVLTRGFAAIVKTIKDGGSIGENFKDITSAFAQELHINVAKTVNTVVKKGQSAQEFLKDNDYISKVFKNSNHPWDELKDKGLQVGAKKIASTVQKFSDSDSLDMLFDGAEKGIGKKLAGFAQKYMDATGSPNPIQGIGTAVNKTLNLMNSNAGALCPAKMSAGFVKWLIQNHPDEMGVNGLCTIIGSTAEVATTITQTLDIVTAATDMLLTIPAVQFVPEYNGGFRIRLGEKGSKNYVYEVGKDDVRQVNKSDHKNDYEDIKKIIVDKNVEDRKNILEASKKEDNNEDIKNKLEEFKKNFENNIDSGECILIYGKRVKEDVNESYISLHDYLIMEGTTVAQIQKNLFDQEYDKSPEKSSNSSTSIYHYLYEPFKYWNKQLAAKKSGKKAGEEIDASGTKANTSHGEELVSLGKKILNKVFNGEYISSDEYKLIVSLYLGQKGQKFGPIIGDATKDNPESIKDGRLNDLFVRIIELTKKLKENKGSKLDGKNGQANSEIKLLYDSIIRILSHVKDWEIDVKNKKVTSLKIQVSDENAKKAAEQLKKRAKEKLPDDNISTKDVTDSVENNKDIPDELKDEIINVVKTSRNETESEEDTSTDKHIEGEDNDNKPDDNKPDDTSSNDESDDKDKKPIMLLIYGYGKDLANADKNGPRKEPYSMKGLFNTCEFMTITKGTSINNLKKLFGGIFNKQISEVYNVIVDKPCNDDKNLYDKKDNDTERPDLANLTNQEATKLINKKEEGEKLVEQNGKVSAAETPKEKEQLKKLHDTNNEAVENDKDLQSKLNEINPDLVDKDGNLNKEEWDRTNDILSEYQLSKHKEKSHKGFFGRMWDSIKKFFSGGDDSSNKHHKYTEKELDRLAELIAEKVKKKMKTEKTNESYEDIIFNQRKSLAQYIKENIK